VSDTSEQKQNGPVKKPRKKRFTPLRITLLVVLILLGFLVIKIILFFNAEPTISVNYLEKWNQISRPKNYDPNKNAAFDYAKTAESMTEFPEILMDTDFDWVGNLPQDKLKKLQNWVASNEKNLVHVIRGAEKPYFWFELKSEDGSLWMFDYDYDLALVRDIAFLIVYKAQLEAMNGSIDVAFEDLITVLKMACQLGDSEISLVKLLGLAEEVFVYDSVLCILYYCNPSMVSIRKFGSNIRQIKPISVDDLDFKWDRSHIQDFVQRIFTDDSQGNGHIIPTKHTKEQMSKYLFIRWFSKEPDMLRQGWLEKIREFVGEIFGIDLYAEPSRITIYSHIIYRALFGPYRKQTMKMIENDFEYFEKFKKMTLLQLKKQGIESDQDLRENRPIHLLSNFLPAFYRYVELYRRGIITRGALIATIAILQYKNDTGRLPKSLEQLVSEGYLNELPMDIYSDKPLVYKKTGDNFILYSYGADFDDDSGTYIDDYGIYVDWGEGRNGGDKVFWPVKRTLSFE